MLNIIKQEINLSPELKKKIDWAKKYTSSEITLKKGTLIRLEPTNLAYVEPHKVVICNTTFLFFNNLNVFYVNDLTKTYKLGDLQEYFKLAKLTDLD